MKTTVTIYKYYFKAVVIEIDSKYTEGKTTTQIQNGLLNETIPYDEEAIQNAALTEMDNSSTAGETDRFDIYNDKGFNVFGGNL